MTAPPPAYYDWPVPDSPDYTIDQFTWLGPVNLNLISQDKFFGLAGNPNFDWPVPQANPDASYFGISIQPQLGGGSPGPAAPLASGTVLASRGYVVV